MPTIYKKVAGARPYMNFSEEKLAEALESIRSGRFSQRKAAEFFKISVSTLKNKLKGGRDLKPGGQTVLCRDEELIFVNHIITMSDYGFPLDSMDLRCIVKCYLDRKGMTITQFKNNFPGEVWVKSFLSRHKVLTTRFASNIKKVRAAISPDTVNQYFDNLKEALVGIPSTNLWNYDETNLTDDPGQKKVITKRGCKYPERVMNTSKSSTSIMFCGNASGEILPPYVVYKADCMWNTWAQNGPKHCRYNRSKSGWFDSTCFDDWFENLLLPRLQKLEGPKAIIGDNLSSHISLHVLKLCEINNIRFICLPPNSTHLTQPLDIAYFRPMKIIWRGILTDYKVANKSNGVVPKAYFPVLLNDLVNGLNENGPQNLKSGFKKAGLVPINRQEVLDRIPSKESSFRGSTGPDESVSFREHVSDAVLEFLATSRGIAPNSSEVPVSVNQRRKKVNVVPGKSVTAEDVTPVVAAPSTSGKKNGTKVTCRKNGSKVKRRKTKAKEVVTSEEEDYDSLSEGEPTMLSSDEEDNSIKPGSKLNDYVIVNYEGELFPGIVSSVGVSEAQVNVMKMTGVTGWKWPKTKDEIWYPSRDIIQNINEPTWISSKGFFIVPEIVELRSKKLC